MAIALTQSDDASHLRLGGEIDISSAAELRAALLEAVSSEKAIRLSMDEVTELDVTAFQLLWATARQTKQAGVGFAVTGYIPKPVRGSLSAMGFDAGAISTERSHR